MGRLGEELERCRQLTGLFGLFGYHGLFEVAGRMIDPDGGMVEHRVGQLLAQRTLAQLQLQLTCSGLEALEGLRNFAVVSNHSSYLDWAVLLGYFPTPLRFVAKRELVYLPVVGAFLKRRGVLIDRKRGKDAKTAIREAVADQFPWPIMLFPEGTRSPDGNLRPFKRGGLRILAEAGLTIVPVCIVGTYEAFPRHARSIRKGSQLSMSVLPPVGPTDFDDVEATIEAVEARIRSAFLAGRELRQS